MKISICIATYNGSLFLKEQLDSIFKEMDSFEEDYEVIIVDDFSTDETLELINSYGCENIKLFMNDKNMGHVKSFEKSLESASGDYIFLSDQDDIWVPGRVALMMDALVKSEKDILFSGFSYIDQHGRGLAINGNFCVIPPLNGRFKNILKIFIGKADYWGCTALLTQSSLKQLLPFYKHIEAHDHWIAQVGLLHNKIHSISDVTLLHRIHNNNVTVKNKRSFLKRILTRYVMLKSFFHAFLRY